MMKKRLGVGTGSKNPRRRVQNTPEHGRMFGVQEPIQHFWSAKVLNDTLKGPNFPLLGFGPAPFG